MNHFDPGSTAERYAKGRPNFHPETIARMYQDLNLSGKVEKALDVACGTGLSTAALLGIADQVYGTDASVEMLNNAILTDQILYALAPAEIQPFQDDTFELITVCSGIHWFDIDAFLLEAKRLLKTDGYLVIYDNFFLSEMKGQEAFENWFPSVYLDHFPSPKRQDSYDWSTDNLAKIGFEFVKEDRFKNEVDFTLDELILYFTTQSNISSAIGRGENYQNIEAFLKKELAPFFESQVVRKTLYFGNWIYYLRPIART